MKKLGIIALALILCMGMLVGCGEDKEAPAEDQAKTEAPAAEESAAGTYIPFAMEKDGLCVEIPEGTFTDGDLVLNEDGTGTMMTDGIENVFNWEAQDNGILYLTNPNDENDLMAGSIDNGIIILILEASTDVSTDSDMKAYYAKEGVDTSHIKTITPEEAQEQMNQ